MNKISKPTTFRLILSVLLVLTIVLGVALFIFGQSELSKYAEETRSLDTEAQASSDELQALSTLKSRLDKSSSDVERAAQIASTSKSYQYQDQVVEDINKHAAAAHIAISSIEFPQANATGTKTGTNTSTSGTTAKSAATAPAGFKPTGATVNLVTPTSYENLYNLILRLENSLFRMQISSLSLTKDPLSNEVLVDALTLEVYMK